MTIAAKKLAKQVLALPESERLKLADVLLKSIPKEGDPPSQEEWDEAWKKELEKRIEEIESGKVKCIPYAVVRKEMDAILGKS
jgi:putative addiction module component (TIGR02574 family)